MHWCIIVSVIELQDPVRTATKGVPAGTPLLYMEVFMAQVFLTYEQQIEKLIYEKNLMVQNREYAVEELKEIHVNKMNFRVVSRHPEYAKNVKSQISRSMRKDLYTVFKKYT